MSYQEPGNIHTTGEERVGTRDVSWRPNTTALQRNQSVMFLYTVFLFSCLACLIHVRLSIRYILKFRLRDIPIDGLSAPSVLISRPHSHQALSYTNYTSISKDPPL